MDYKGKLYGKLAGCFFETGKTSEDWDRMEEKIKELEHKENLSDCIMFYASNDMPPSWVLNMSNTPNTHKEAADKIRELHSWDVVLFVLTEKDGLLIPLTEENKDRKINEFKYLFRL